MWPGSNHIFHLVYPNLRFTHLQNGSSIFHPILSDVEITQANTHADLACCTLNRTWPAEEGWERSLWVFLYVQLSSLWNILTEYWECHWHLHSEPRSEVWSSQQIKTTAMQEAGIDSRHKDLQIMFTTALFITTPKWNKPNVFHLWIGELWACTRWNTICQQKETDYGYMEQYGWISN